MLQSSFSLFIRKMINFHNVENVELSVSTLRLSKRNKLKQLQIIARLLAVLSVSVFLLREITFTVIVCSALPGQA